MIRPRLHALASAAALAAVALLAAILAGGCGTTGSLSPNTPPETVIFVSGPVDTVNHVVRLRWLGSDSDGQVVRFEYKWIYEAGQEPAGYDSAAWSSTTKTDSTFTVFTPSGYSMPQFVVRSVDDAGDADPTPARQFFQFSNQPPTLAIVGTPRLPPSTLPVLTVRWASTDPDGNINQANYLVWLDGDESNARLVPPGNQFTLTPDFFDDGAGGYETGPHTVYVQAVDAGGSASPPDTASWVVRAPEGDVLLVDDVPASLGTAADQAYRAAFDLQLGVGPGTYTLINIDAANPFRTPEDIAATFAFFQSVVWYQDNSTGRSPMLSLSESAIRSSLAAGRNVYVCSVTLVGTNAALPSPDFLGEIVGADSVRLNPKTGTSNFSINNNSLLHPGSNVPYDSLSAVVISTNVDALALRNANEVAFLGKPIVIDSTQVDDWFVGVDRVPSGGTGRFVFLSFPLRFMGNTPPGAPAPAPDPNYAAKTVRRVLYRFGHGAPVSAGIGL
ncbi:MAG: hypothetical protein ACREOU_12305 [Candidatus Eiseniibacteriota bacterium]